MSKDALSTKEQRLASVAALAALGKRTALRVALAESLDAGWTVNEVKEVLVQLYAYAGFPRSLNALDTLIDVLDERRSKGIEDRVGTTPSPFPNGESNVERGTALQSRLLGPRAAPRYASFAPEIDTFLKGHLFGDILARDNLDVRSRELATISMLATLDGVEPQLGAHFGVGMKVGLTEAQLRSLTAVIDETAGKEFGDRARAVLAQVIEKRAAPSPAPSSAGIATSDEQAPTITVRHKEALVTEAAPALHFTGAVQLQRLFQPSDPAHASAAEVAFEPRSRTAWHSHPLGQALIVTSGTGWVQQWGQPALAIREGDVAWIPPRVKHWHGASVRFAMTHLAVQEQFAESSVEWMEAVSDEQYATVERP